MGIGTALTDVDIGGISVLQFMTTVHFGFGARKRLAGLLEAEGITRPLVVSDHGVVKAGVLAQALEHVAGADKLSTYLDTPPNPTEQAARDGADLYRQAGCDGIIAVGGGAAIDLAKGIAILATNDGILWEFCNRHSSPRKFVNPAPLIVMPTTSGSGSEVGRSAVIVFDNGIKAGVASSGIVRAAICDPELTFGLPPKITAATGMDALSHCVETFSSPTVNPPADAIALDGLRRCLAHLLPAVQGGEGQRAARWHMMMGSLQGAVCFQKGMGAVHSLSHPIGALGAYHHGTLNAIFLPAVLRYNREALGQKMALMNDCLPAADNGSDIAAYVADLLPRIGLPTRLSEMGLTRTMLADIPRQALQDNAHKTNPRPLAEADYQHLIDAVF
jgi:4-hydroxybutyrate dehydrogenase